MKAAKLLEEHLTLYEDKTCDYGDGWTDKRVAAEVGMAVSSVSYLRSELYGALRSKPAEPIVDVAGLQRRIERIESFLAEDPEWKAHTDKPTPAP